MTPWIRTHPRPFLALLLVPALLAGPASGAGAPAASEPRTTAPAAGAAGKKTTKDAKKPQSRPAQTRPAEAVARSLRESGQIVSQSGDLDLSVQSNVFTEFPGFNLDHLSKDQRDKLVKRANTVYCTCGCRGDTVARCVVLDPACQTARRMMKRMLDQASAADETHSASPDSPKAPGAAPTPDPKRKE
ncbi:MAG: hypothetical protein ACE5HD_11590 [Acidobacteriota bacterium]